MDEDTHYAVHLSMHRFLKVRILDMDWTKWALMLVLVSFYIFRFFFSLTMPYCTALFDWVLQYFSGSLTTSRHFYHNYLGGRWLGAIVCDMPCRDLVVLLVQHWIRMLTEPLLNALKQRHSECQSRFQQWFPPNESSSASNSPGQPSAFRSKWSNLL